MFFLPGYGIFMLLTVQAQTLGMLVVNLKEECCVFFCLAMGSLCY